VKDTLNTAIFMIHEETISPDHHEGSKSTTPYDQYAERANNMPPSVANMLNRVIHQRYLHEGTKSATPY